MRITSPLQRLHGLVRHVRIRLTCNTARVVRDFLTAPAKPGRANPTASQPLPGRNLFPPDVPIVGDHRRGNPPSARIQVVGTPDGHQVM